MTEDRYITGFRAGRDAAKAVCNALADRFDGRPESARLRGHPASQSVRRLRQAASMVDALPLPYGMDDPA